MSARAHHICSKCLLTLCCCFCYCQSCQLQSHNYVIMTCQGCTVWLGLHRAGICVLFSAGTSWASCHVCAEIAVYLKADSVCISVWTICNTRYTILDQPKLLPGKIFVMNAAGLSLKQIISNFGCRFVGNFLIEYTSNILHGWEVLEKKRKEKTYTFRRSIYWETWYYTGLPKMRGAMRLCLWADSSCMCKSAKYEVMCTCTACVPCA